MSTQTMTHTPGPWTLDRLHAALNGTGTEAEARLIAAAPAMLTALRTFVAEWNDTYDVDQRGDGTLVPNQVMALEVYELALAAVRKAQGGGA